MKSLIRWELRKILSKKIYFTFFVTLLFTTHVAQGQNLTEKARTHESGEKGQYDSDAGLTYKGYFRLPEPTRVQHIKAHIRGTESRQSDKTLFNNQLLVRYAGINNNTNSYDQLMVDDIVLFIDLVYRKIKRHIGNHNHSNNIVIKLNLNGRLTQYRVKKNREVLKQAAYHNSRIVYTYELQPHEDDDANAPVTGFDINQNKNETPVKGFFLVVSDDIEEIVNFERNNPNKKGYNRILTFYPKGI